MKIAFNFFPLEKVGGIITSKTNLIKGFTALGHTVDEYFITTNTTKLPEKNTFDVKNILGFEKDEWFAEYKRTMEQYDLVLFIHPAPHLLKNFTRDSWKKCYEINVPKMCFFRDPYFEKYYSWFRDIPSQQKVKIICGQQKFYDSIKGVKGMKKIILNPFSVPDAGLYDELKEDLIVDHNNFKGVKHKEMVIEHADALKAKIIEYGSDETLEYKEATKMKNWPLIEFKGWASFDIIKEDLKRAKLVTDLSRFSNVDNNYDHCISEAIAYGAMPVIITKMCPQHDMEAIFVPSKNQLPYILNRALENFGDYAEARKRNLEKLKKLDPEKICQQIIDYHNEPYAEEVTGINRWFT